MEIKEFKTIDGIDAVQIINAPKISLFKTFDCGQCFRFEPVSLFGNKYEVAGVAFGRYVVFAQNSESELIIYNSTRQDFFDIWYSYLSLDVDYDEIDKDILSKIKDEHMKRAVEYGSGIRILSQDAWECIISFIISQNNNIPRIKKIVSAICEKYGEVVEFRGERYYSFPTPHALSVASVDELYELRMGFRARYIYDACRVVSADLDMLSRIKADDYKKSLESLCKIKGIGLKVASCALLFGAGRGEAFPIDVHMKRTLEKNFPNGFDYISLGKNAGIAQQYLFYYEKYNQNS